MKKRHDLYFSKIKPALRSLLLKLKIYYIYICLSIALTTAIASIFFISYKNNRLKEQVKNLEKKTSDKDGDFFVEIMKNCSQSYLDGASIIIEEERCFMCMIEFEFFKSTYIQKQKEMNEKAFLSAVDSIVEAGLESAEEEIKSKDLVYYFTTIVKGRGKKHFDNLLIIVKEEQYLVSVIKSEFLKLKWIQEQKKSRINKALNAVISITKAELECAKEELKLSKNNRILITSINESINTKENEKRNLSETMLGLIRCVNPNFKNNLSSDKAHIILRNILARYAEDRNKRICKSSEAKQKCKNQKYLLDICEALKTSGANQEYDDKLHEEVLNILYSIRQILEEKQLDRSASNDCSAATSRRSSMCLQSPAFELKRSSMSESFASCSSNPFYEQAMLEQHAERVTHENLCAINTNHSIAAFAEGVVFDNKELESAIQQLDAEGKSQVESLMQKIKEACLNIERLKQDAESERQVFAGLVESKQSKINELIIKLENADREKEGLKKSNNRAKSIVDSLVTRFQPSKSKI